ncbi:uncharacterized protein E0L32_004537 [Thyridium curvatum]|uniref:Uncharacterized protein n=1 Tax=Thyridium curvatum TaxID=1093900 RepID=A0A507BFD7_9PEZI|nr:uncharacterized protein E0L32_004537 [Thyridium curvatum]TPX15260.1 hypothetical protein E0L32_004537 [Thyridium curvatum]
MSSSTKNVLLRTAGLLAALTFASAAPAEQAATAGQRVIHKDVVILGGGASGAHAAVRLREDFGKSIVLVEKQGRLGGHVSTYIDPESGRPIDFGVQSFIDIGGAKDFFARMNVSIGTPGRIVNKARYVDFKTGEELDYVPPAAADRTAGLTKFAAAASKYESMLLPGYWNFPAGKDIPEELLMPFGDFARKYGFEAAMPTIFSVTGLGVGDITKELTMYVLQAFGAPMARAMLGQVPTFVPASHRNQDLYDNIAALLGSDVLYSTTATRVERKPGCGVEVTVRDRAGRETLIKAKRILVSIEPVGNNMAPFDLDRQERAVFAKMDYSRIYAGIVTNAALPGATSFTNFPTDAAPSNYMAFPELPFTARFDNLGGDLFRVMILGDRDTMACAAKRNAQASLDRMLQAGTVAFPEGFAGRRKLTFKAFADHGPMHVRVTADQLRAGFVQEQYALQGHRDTWYTGGAWSVQFQTILWQYNDIVIPKLLQGM